MTDDPFVSYAQNGEDVLLWRALGHIANGRYVDVGAWDPVEHSVTKAFYDRGWRGISVEPVPELAAALRAARPEDEVVEAAVSSTGGSEVTFHRIHEVGAVRELTGLSTLKDAVASAHDQDRFEVRDITVETRTLASICASPLLGGVIHFLKIDVEGGEADALRSMDFGVHRPWVVVVEATKPLSSDPSHEEWEGLLLAADYEFCVFDGLSRFYVAAEHPELKSALSYPVCVFDEYVPAVEHSLREQLAVATAENQQLRQGLLVWRAVALIAQARGARRVAALKERQLRIRARADRRAAELTALRGELDGVRGSISWRVTKPLRWVRARGSGRAGGHPKAG